MTAPETATRSCDHRMWRAGADVRCGQTVAVKVWRDYAGHPHGGCPRHIDAILHRHPEALPEALPHHGKLSLNSPWARGAFGPGDRINIQNAIPEGYEIGVSVTANRGHIILWAIDPEGAERARWTGYRLARAIEGASDLAAYLTEFETNRAAADVLVAL